MKMSVRPATLSNLRPKLPYVCLQCQQRRYARELSRNRIALNEGSKEQWKTWAAQIKSGERKGILKVLEERGFIHQVAGDRDTLEKVMTHRRVGVYCGVDPTAPSMHVGHMLPFMALFWLYFHGYQSISIMGGATSKIGDPTGRTTDRPAMSSIERKANIVSMHYQLKKLWANVEGVGKKHGLDADVYCRKGLVNNAVWWNKLPFLEVLKYLGSGLRVGEMLAKDTVKTKMESGQGISFSEFCYPLLQGWDWWELYQQRGVQIQIGGADQYGNIVAGMDAVKHLLKTHPEHEKRKDPVQEFDAPYGFTVPLLTTASGAKFGKSAGNAVWLDPQMTSTFDLYGYFVGTADADVERYLKLFTFLPLNKIQGLMRKHENDKSKRTAQHELAYQFTMLVHGEQVAKSARGQHTTLFANRNNPTLSALLSGPGSPGKTAIQYAQAVPEAQLPPVPANPLHLHQEPSFRDRADDSSVSSNKYAPQVNANSAPAAHTVLPKSLIFNRSCAVALWSAGLVKSRSEGHRLGAAGGAYIGRRAGDDPEMRDQVEFRPMKIADPMLMWDNVIAASPEEQAKGEEGLLVLRVGKWKVRICRIVSDNKYKELLSQGEVAEAPGWTEYLALDTRKRAESANAINNVQELEQENRQTRMENTKFLGSAASDAAEADPNIDLDRPDSDPDSAHGLTRKQREQERYSQRQAAIRSLEDDVRSEVRDMTGMPSAWGEGRAQRKPPVPAQDRFEASGLSDTTSRRPSRTPFYSRELKAFLDKGEAERKAAENARKYNSAGLEKVLREKIRKHHEEQARKVRRADKERKIQTNKERILARREASTQRRRHLREGWKENAHSSGA